jgi:hypothetical protein
VLREIKTQDSPHADCVEAWQSCLAQKNIDINRKKLINCGFKTISGKIHHHRMKKERLRNIVIYPML